MSSYGGEKVDELFSQIIDQIPASDPAHVRVHAYGLLRALTLEEKTRCAAEEAADGGIVGRAQALMRDSFPASLTVAQVARACGTTPAALNRAFAAQEGKTAHRWYQMYLMGKAQELLVQTDLSVTRIAAEVGYANPSKFARAFRNETGESPSAWRAARM